MSLNDVLIDKRESYRVSIRKQQRHAEREIIRNKFMEKLQFDPRFEVSFYILKLNELAQHTNFQSKEELNKIVLDLHSNIRLLEIQ